MYRSYSDKAEYIARMSALKKANLAEIRRTGRRPGLRGLLRRLKAGLTRAAAGDTPDYFSDERIAVYTVIFGGCDNLLEPACRPDNCDFYLISDTIEPPEGSAFKILSPPEPETGIAMNGPRKNRFFKMMPHLLFPDYRYSVYLDGNIRLVTDPTEYINRMPPLGISLHRHVSRDCVYEEAEAIIAQKKAPEAAMLQLTEFLRSERMPSRYGLLECPVIVRRHHQPECRELMEAWWALFERYPYRDQMLLPYLLYKRGIRPEELAGLGNNVRMSPSFRRYSHIT